LSYAGPTKSVNLPRSGGRALRRPALTKTDSPPEWMTIEDVADYLKSSHSKLDAIAQRG